MRSEDIKKLRSMQEVAESYGVKVKHGMCCCPFHKEKNPSMKIYKDNYRCFSCGASGDIFSFVQQIEKCDFKTAFTILGGTYADDAKTVRKATERARRAREEREQRKERERLENIKKADNFRVKNRLLIADVNAYKQLLAEVIPGSEVFWEYLDKYHKALNQLQMMEEGVDSC